MCGIVGYVGKANACEILLNGLRRLEYRGYDSAGIAIVDDGRLHVLKSTGKVAKLAERVANECPEALRLRAATGLNRTVLSGGCFQNRLLLEGCIAGLEKAGFDVYSHHLVPTGDGGISLGQAIVAASRIN